MIDGEHYFMLWVPYICSPNEKWPGPDWLFHREGHARTCRTHNLRNESYSRDTRKRKEKGDLTPQWSIPISGDWVDGDRAASYSSQQQYQESTVTILKKHLYYYMLLRRHWLHIRPWSLSYLIGSNWIPKLLLLVPSTKLASSLPFLQVGQCK